ncbi:MAG: VWA domain-containing protein, partial [Terriglobales bacterium]
MARRPLTLIASLLFLVGSSLWLLAQQATQPNTQQQVFTFKTTTSIVLINLSVKDSSGKAVTNLKPGDVIVLEDGKPQHIASFDFENVDAPAALETASAANAAAGPSGTIEAGQPVPTAKKPAVAAIAAPAANQYRDRRLLVLYFDLTTMQPEDVANVMKQAQHFVQAQMRPADLVAIATLGNTLQVNQDFTSDKAALTRTLEALN